MYERESVIIFDEVQLQPLARQAVKHLVKDHRYDYIETGSLVSVRSKSRNILVPSEETKVDMYPMDSWRYCHAKRDIIALYEEDFGKIDDSGRAKALYDAIPAQLSRNTMRYQVSKAVSGERAERIVNIVKEMEDSMTVNVVYHSDDPNVGLALTKNEEYFKMYASDTGLFVTLAFKDADITENVIYDKLLNDKLSTNLGYVYENVIAQMLKATGKNLFYHTIPYAGGKKYYEIDFVIPDRHKISPIEVKSSGYKTHKSLDEFCSKFSDRIMNKYLIYTKDYRRENGVEYIPVYMTMFS